MYVRTWDFIEKFITQNRECTFKLIYALKGKGFLNQCSVIFFKRKEMNHIGILFDSPDKSDIDQKFHNHSVKQYEQYIARDLNITIRLLLKKQLHFLLTIVLL